MKPIKLVKRELKMTEGGFPLMLCISDDEFISCKGFIYYYVPVDYVDKPIELVTRHAIQEKLPDIWNWFHIKIKDAYEKHKDKNIPKRSSFLKKEFKPIETYSKDGLEINFEIEFYTDIDTKEQKCSIWGTKCI